MPNCSQTEYKIRYEENKEKLLQPGEYAIQMVNHHPAYFITNKARVISCYRKNPIVLKQYMRWKKNCSKGRNYEKVSVKLYCNNENKWFYVHKLVADYFPVKTFIPNGDTGRIEDHHMYGYDREHPEESNRPENLLRTTEKAHHLAHKANKSFTNEKKNRDFIMALDEIAPEDKITVAWGDNKGNCGIETVDLQELLAMFERTQVFGVRFKFIEKE